MNFLAGTRALVRLALRRDRITLPVWIYALVALTVGTAASFSRLYPTLAGRRAFAAGVADNPALTALYGRLLDATSIGALTAWRIGFNGAALAGLMSLMTVVRHTRAEEETGRLELLGSGVVGRHAPLTAGLLVAFATNVLLGLLLAVGLIAVGLAAPGALALGLAFVTTGWLFSAVGAVAAQLTETARAANGIGIGVLGLSVALRAAGDSGGDGLSWLSWVSPAAWPEQLRPFAGERWWALALPLLSTAVLLGVAYALVSRRDLGAGLLPARPGPAQAAPMLRSPLALAWRLQRGVLAGWTFGFAIIGAVFGSLAAGIGDLLRSNSQLMQTINRLGGGQHVLVDAYLSAILGIFGTGVAAYAVQVVLRLRSEETAQRAEPVLATAVTRLRWAWSHLTFAALGSAVVLATAGLAAGLTHGLRTHDVATQVPRLLGAALVQLPAVWVLAGITVALFGLLPRQVQTSWGILGAFLLLGEVGPVLQLSQWVIDLSPFAHVPRVLGSALTVTPLIGLAAAAAVLTTVGLAGFRQRDIG
jgi:ABC-2 type transport system permease protein